MSWTTPTVRATGDLITASIWNNEVVGNLNSVQMIGAIAPAFGPIAYTPMAASNKACFCRVWIPAISFVQLNFYVGVQSGNIDVGIYSDTNGLPDVRQWSRGSVACPAAGANVISVAAGTPTSLVLAAGFYWLAFVADNTTATFAGVTAGFLPGVVSASLATAFPLPASAAGAASDSRGVYLVAA